jgi:hypothetical protein
MAPSAVFGMRRGADVAQLERAAAGARARQRRGVELPARIGVHGDAALHRVADLVAERTRFAGVDAHALRVRRRQHADQRDASAVVLLHATK